VELIRLEPEGSEAPLRVRGPRLAYDETGTQLAEWELDDVVRDIGDRRFVFEGRRSLLVNINGRRVYLDRVEDSLRAAVPCRDLACLPVRDDVRGEGFDVLIVPDASRPLTATEARERWTAALDGVGQPRRIDLVAEIDRSPTGKVLLDRR
jgi:acyl-coenzyme A synthetase/AMP-(fatty) acid ligase